ncbi:MAG TPA: STAS domain-containing protein, partial [Terriglobales bacterium]|nr:STAS domain-containing protein [Terriglobales bacterium]
MLLNIQREAAPAGVTVLKLTGRITLGNSCQELEWEIDKLMDEGSKGVVLDLSRIDRVDSAGIGILTLSAGKLRKAGGQLRLAGAQGAV